MIRTIIIDDEPLARTIVVDYLRDHPEVTVVAECNDGFEGVKAIAEHKPHLVFLDIQMPRINGFEMLELVDDPPSVIFTTAFDEHAIKAFEANAVDYLLKPFSKERFDKAMQKWLQQRDTSPAPGIQELRQPEEANRIVVREGPNIRIIPVGEVLYIEAYDDYVKIHTDEGTFLKNRTMASFEERLDPLQFVRVHRSFIVKIDHIIRLEPHEKEGHIAVLSDGKKVNVSKNGYTRLKQLLGM